MMNNRIVANDGKFSFFTGGEQPVKVSDGYIDVVIVDVSKVERYYVSRKSVGNPAYKQRLLVIDPRKLGGDAATKADIFEMTINGASIFDTHDYISKGYSLRNYMQRLATPRPEFPHGINRAEVITRIKFNRDSTIPSHLGFSGGQHSFLTKGALSTLSKILAMNSPTQHSL